MKLPLVLGRKKLVAHFGLNALLFAFGMAAIISHSALNQHWMLLTFEITSFLAISIHFIFFLVRPSLKALETLEAEHERLSTEQAKRIQELNELDDQLMEANKTLQERNSQIEQNLLEQQQSLELLRLSSKRFQDLFQGLPVACFSCDVTGQIFEWNRQAEVLFHLPGYATFSVNFLDILIPADERDAWQNRLDAIAAQEEVQSVSGFWRIADGTTKSVLASAFPISGANGQVSGIVFAIADLTAQNQLFNEMSALKTKVSALLSFWTDPAAIFDSNGFLECTNQAFNVLFSNHNNEKEASFSVRLPMRDGNGDAYEDDNHPILRAIALGELPETTQVFIGEIEAALKISALGTSFLIRLILAEKHPSMAA